MTTALFLLRAVRIGLTLADLDDLEVGMVADMMTESENDDHNYKYVATQEDFDRW